jgi:hypothetical protein
LARSGLEAAGSLRSATSLGTTGMTANHQRLGRIPHGSVADLGERSSGPPQAAVRGRCAAPQARTPRRPAAPLALGSSDGDPPPYTCCRAAIGPGASASSRSPAGEAGASGDRDALGSETEGTAHGGATHAVPVGRASPVAGGAARRRSGATVQTPCGIANCGTQVDSTSWFSSVMPKTAPVPRPRPDPG